MAKKKSKLVPFDLIPREDRNYLACNIMSAVTADCFKSAAVDPLILVTDPLWQQKYMKFVRIMTELTYTASKTDRENEINLLRK